MFDDPNVFITCVNCTTSVRATFDAATDAFLLSEHPNCEQVGQIPEDQESQIHIHCIGHGRASQWQNAMDERQRTRRMQSYDGPTDKLVNVPTPVPVGDAWHTLYAATSLAFYQLQGSTPKEVLQHVDGGVGYRPLVVVSYETRVLLGNPTGIYTESFCPRLDEDDHETTRNLKVLAIDPRYWDWPEGTVKPPSISDYCNEQGIKGLKFRKKELDAIKDAS